uniref:Alpha-type protein kinase domain-containing protein n=1 Tax=Rhabditophanes sp. KR3021 TaxID=114890 RepID=A0AC35U1B6_9BILA
MTISVLEIEASQQSIIHHHALTSNKTLSFNVGKRERIIKLWKKCAIKALDLVLKDPWAKYNIDKEPTQRCTRFRYNALTKKWTEDIVHVKMQKTSFGRGAMRECFRLKKMPHVCHEGDWKYSMNYVCKKYIQEVSENVLFEDVKLQMDAKLWAEEYNRHNPPKKIDIFQMGILKFDDEDVNGYYHIEHFIEGKYVKHNSNSGFVSDLMRMTPNAFSHFTFERSGHQLIVVDIQGVGDLYTDPQIHTVCGTDYGDGNLGTKGTSLFFYSHQCNDICKLMKLTEFDMSPNENKDRYRNMRMLIDPSTKFTIKANPTLDICEPIVNYRENAMERLRLRSTRSINSCHSLESNYDSTHCEKCLCNDCLENDDFLTNKDNLYPSMEDDDDSMFDDRGTDKESVDNSFVKDEAIRRRRYYSQCSLTSLNESEAERFHSAIKKFSRPAGFLMPNIANELANAYRNSNSLFVLGQVHLDMARYYEIGKFSDVCMENKHSLLDDSSDGKKTFSETCIYDKESAIFHLNVARKCGVLESIKTMAEICYDIQHDLLKDVCSKDLNVSCLAEEGNIMCFGFKLMELAAEMCDRNAIHFVATAYQNGYNLPEGKQCDWNKALYLYSKALEIYTESEEEFPDCMGRKKDVTFVIPHYEILANMAQMFNDGGFGLAQNIREAFNLYNEAAECASEAMKGKLACKYFELAEMCEFE